MHRLAIVALCDWTVALTVLTVGLARYILPPWNATRKEARTEEFKKLKRAPLLSVTSKGVNPQVLELSKQAEAIADFIKSEPPTDNLTQAVSLLESTNRQVMLANSTPSLGTVWKGTRPADAGQFPYQVGIVLNNYVPYAKRGYECGGALISPTWVITAGHCFQDDSQAQDIAVYTGHVNLSESSASNCNCWTSVKRLVRYPNYQLVRTPYGIILDGDVALLELSDRPSGSGVQSIRMTTAELEPDLVKTSLGTISGWGKSTDNVDSLSDALLYGTVKITPRTACSKSYGGGIIQEDMVCALPLPSDACQGDSGGPLVMQFGTGANRISYLEGVISWTYPPGGCPSTKPTVYSRVAAFSDWITGCISGGTCPSSIPRTPLPGS